MTSYGESTFIGACALRFDGYRYGEETGFGMGRANAALEHFYETGEWDAGEMERLTTFFLMQRRFRWQNCGLGWEEEDTNSDEWRAYRTLFLELCERPIPDHYKTTYYAEWEERFAPHLAEFKKQVEAALAEPQSRRDGPRESGDEGNGIVILWQPSRDEGKRGDEPPELTEEDERALDRVWAELDEEERDRGGEP